MVPPRFDIRPATHSEIAALGRLWHDGWRDGHEGLLPPELVRDRTLERFTQRIEHALADIRVVGPPEAPLGFYMLKADELYQFYVAREARGSGLAAALIAAAESSLRNQGVHTAWLDCAIGNHRAARFYEKSGWQRSGVVVSQLEISTGTFALEVWRYEKVLV